jgi:ABC-type bacteriocin/lantibiotic exporter with double-glycine peptidase domain
MSIETVARQTLYRQAHASGGDLRSLFDRGLLSRIWHFAARHHRRLGGFVAVSVVSAVLGVATPVLAGKVVDEIVRGGTPVVVVVLAGVIAAVAIAEAAVSLVTRWLSSNIAHRGLRPCAAHAGRVLHSHPHRRVGKPAR